MLKVSSKEYKRKFCPRRTSDWISVVIKLLLVSMILKGIPIDTTLLGVL